LFDPELPVLKTKEVKPGQVSLLYNIGRVNLDNPEVLCGSGRVSSEKMSKDRYEISIKGPANIINVSRIWMPHKPDTVIARDKNKNPKEMDYAWDEYSSTIKVKFDNEPDGVDLILHH